MDLTSSTVAVIKSFDSICTGCQTELIKNFNTGDILPSVVGAFSGALFAFAISMLSIWLERRHLRRKICEEEHRYLDRYLGMLRYIIIDNKDILQQTCEGYQGKEKTTMLNPLWPLPIREDSSMKVEDKLFMNRLETYINVGIKRLNRHQEGIELMRKILNDELLGNVRTTDERFTKNLAEFERISREVSKWYDYYLEVVENLIVENKLLIKKFKKRTSNKLGMEDVYEERSKKIVEEKKLGNSNKNPLIQEQEELLKKHGLSNKGT